MIPIPSFTEPLQRYDQPNEAQFRREVIRVIQELEQFVAAKDVTGSPSTLATGNNNDYAIGTETSVLRLTPHASGSTLTGIVAPKGERRVTVVNLGSADLTLADEDSNSSADNRFTIPRGNLVLTADEQAELLYDSTSKRWRVNSASQFVGCTAYRETSAFNLTDASWVAVQWNAEAFDTDTFHDTGSNPSRFTIPSGLAGKYRISFGVMVVCDDTAATAVETQVRKDGATFGYGYGKITNGATTQTFTVMGTVDVDLSASEYVELYVNPTSNNGTPSASVGSWMGVQLLGNNG